jgi:alpha-D-ribose 1-methylphosphonate 5-triphosphate diphosphatase PhnM
MKKEENSKSEEQRKAQARKLIALIAAAKGEDELTTIRRMHARMKERESRR